MRKFNYILNDIAFDNLVIKCLYGEPTDEDIEECENQIKLLQQQNKKYKEVIDKAMKYIQKMIETGFHNDDYYLGHLKQILQDKEVK